MTILAQATAPATGGGVMDLFLKSFDVFTILLLLASLFAVTIIIKALIEVSARNIAPSESEGAIRRTLQDRNVAGLEALLQRDTSFYGHVLRAAHACPGERVAIRNAAELAASEQCSRWFRKIEPLNVIGNIGPLLGLAGTVYGMVMAFSALQSTAGNATPADLSGGIAKALFHTLLGLMVALPALLVFGLYRSKIDGLCTRAMAVSAELVEGYCELRDPAPTTPASNAFTAFNKTT